MLLLRLCVICAMMLMVREEGLLSQDSFLFSEVFTFEFGLTPQFTPVSERPRVFLDVGVSRLVK